MNRKVQSAFALFVLLFLVLSAIQSVGILLQSARKLALDGYDSRMKSRNVRVVQPEKHIESPYGEPLPENPPVVQPEKKNDSNSPDSLFSKYKTISAQIAPARKGIEGFIDRAFPFRDEFSTFNMAFKYHLGIKEPVEGTLLLPNGKLALISRNIDPEFTAAETEELKQYKKICEDNKVHFFLVLRPRSEGFHADIHEPYKGLQLNYGERFSRKAQQLEELGIKTFKLYEAMRAEVPREKWQDYWFMTDHHWNVDGALVGGRLIADYMNKNCGTSYDLKYFDAKTYIRKRWEDSFVGSIGKKMSAYYYKHGDHEDFDILYPRFKTDFTLQIPSQSHRKHGDFSCLIYADFMCYDVYQKNPYRVFLDGDQPFCRIVNNKIPSGKKIILIKDSYCNAMVPYLALQTKEIILMDPRYYPQKKIRETIAKEKPDIVFILFDYGYFVKKAAGE